MQVHFVNNIKRFIITVCYIGEFSQIYVCMIKYDDKVQYMDDKAIFKSLYSYVDQG